jgi:hypothetical protein
MPNQWLVSLETSSTLDSRPGGKRIYSIQVSAHGPALEALKLRVTDVICHPSLVSQHSGNSSLSRRTSHDDEMKFST